MEFSWVAQPSDAPATRGTLTAVTTARCPHNPPASLNAIKDTIYYSRALIRVRANSSYFSAKMYRFP